VKPRSSVTWRVTWSPPRRTYSGSSYERGPVDPGTARLIEERRGEPRRWFAAGSKKTDASQWPCSTSTRSSPWPGTHPDVPELAGYRQVTDAHLLTLARRSSMRLVTFDAGMVRLHRLVLGSFSSRATVPSRIG
jgi:hypothetical protein